MKFIIVLIAWALFFASVAGAQTAPGLIFGQVPTAAQWNSYFAAKMDTKFSAPNKTALTILSTATYPAIQRMGYAVAGDAPPLVYIASPSPCSLNAGAGDGGYQVPSSNGGCWIAAFDGEPDPREWGADATGAIDSAPALAAAILAQTQPGCAVGFAKGTYNFNSGITVVNPCRIHGLSKNTIINVNFSSGNFITITQPQTEIDHLIFHHTVAHTSGADINCAVIRCQIHDNYDDSYYISIIVSPASTLSVLVNDECRNGVLDSTVPGGTCVQIGARGGGGNPEANIIQNITGGQDSGATGPTSIVHIESGDANLIINPNFLQGEDNILIDPVVGDSALDTKITGGYVDSAHVNNLRVSPSGGNVARIYANGTWFGDAVTGSGIFLDNLGAGVTTGFTCIDCQLVLDAQNGLIANSDKWSDISIRSSCIAGDTTAVALVAGVNYGSIQDNHIGSCLGISGNTNGIGTTGSISNWQITGNNFTGTTNPGNPNNFSGSIIENNVAWNPIGVSTGTVGPSPATITNGAAPSSFYFSQSGTNTATVSIGGNVVGTLLASNVVGVTLGPNESVVVTWSTTAPTYIKSVH